MHLIGGTLMSVTPENGGEFAEQMNQGDGVRGSFYSSERKMTL